MSNAQLWAALQQSAMVGSDRLAVPPVLASGVDPSAPLSQQAVQAALLPRADLPGDSAAQQLLRASAVAAVFERAGWQPGAQVHLAAPLAPPAAAPAESRPAPGDARLQALMGDVLRDGPFDVQASMLRTLDQAGQRLPHELLVPALEQGRQSAGLRPWLAPVLGERGRWLGSLNPQWGYASGVEETADPELVWQEGSVEQRVALLRAERGTDAARARLRLEGSLKELGAKERLPMVQALAVGLGLEDEPLLEKLLSDRSKEIRDNAAQLLSCLPDSAHSRRIMGWMQSMLVQDAKGQWSVEPPEEGPKEWERDGIALKPDAYHRGGKKSWLLEQMVRLTPLSFWSRTPGMAPAELMEWSRRSDWKSSLRQGWLQALQYQQDVAWLDAVQMMGRDMRHDTLMPALLARLSPQEREARWLAQFERDRHKLLDAIESMSQSLAGAEQLSADMSARLAESLHQTLGNRQVTGNWNSYRADQALLACARMLDVSALARFADLWRQPEQAPLSDAQPQTPADAGQAATTAAPLTAEQQARLDRSRQRPWDEERMRDQLERIVDLRLGLHQAFLALKGQA